MSINIHLSATANVTFVSGATKRLYEHCRIGYQTTSKQTEEILASDNPEEAYLSIVPSNLRFNEKQEIKRFYDSHPPEDGWVIEWEAW